MGGDMNETIVEGCSDSSLVGNDSAGNCTERFRYKRKKPGNTTGTTIGESIIRVHWLPDPGM